MGFEPELFEVSDEALAEESLSGVEPTASEGLRGSSLARGLTQVGYPSTNAFVGIGLDRLRREGPIRLNLPTNYAPFAQGNFGTPSGKCELFQPGLAGMGIDPLPTYTRRTRIRRPGPISRPISAANDQPAGAAFLNSTFVNVDSLRRQIAGSRRWRFTR